MIVNKSGNKLRYVECRLEVIAFEVEKGFATSGKMNIVETGTASNAYNLRSINSEIGVGENNKNQRYEKAWGWENGSEVWN